MKIHKKICTFTNFFGLDEYNKYVSVITDIENMNNLSKNLGNNLFYFNNFCLILCITITIIIGIIIIYSKPFQEGLKAALTLGATIAAGAQIGAAGRGRDEDERRRREEEERRRREEEERRRREEEERRRREEDKTKNDKKKLMTKLLKIIIKVRIS